MYPDTGYARQIQVDVTVTTVADTTDVMVDSQAIYLPPRPDFAALIPDPTSVDVTVERLGRPKVRRMLGRVSARAFVEILRTLPTMAPGIRSCAVDLGTVRDVLTFATRRGPVVVTDLLSGCGGISISDDPEFGLEDVGPGALDRAVLVAVGLRSPSDR